MIQYINKDKVINAILYFAKNTRFLGKTKLFKLLFFLDFTHFKQTGRSVSGYNYKAWDRGPVPPTLFNKLDNKKVKEFDYKIIIEEINNFQKIIPKGESDLKVFSKREQKLLGNVRAIGRQISLTFFTPCSIL